MLFTLIQGNGTVKLDIYAALEKNNFSESTGCEGFWAAHTHNILQDKDHWAQENCFLYNRLENKALQFSGINNVTKIIGQYENKLTWICNYEDKFWEFNLSKCDWVLLHAKLNLNSEKFIDFSGKKSSK